ncbi:MAG: biopolymer transporter ExbD [Candidatus Omnitrophica bacterium]|nr:biopolymer transporter ExbD [Candidatus Omnitrophota bacterium]
MRTRRLRRTLPKSSGIRIIPLIDVMFLLLAFFVLTTMNLVARKGIFVDLATSETSKDLGPGTGVVRLTIDRQGQYYLGAQAVDDESMKALLANAKSRGVPYAVIDADERTAHGRVVRLLDMVRQSGLREAAISVKDQSANPRVS